MYAQVCMPVYITHGTRSNLVELEKVGFIVPTDDS